MSSGAAVVRYHGARGTVYRIKFTDAAGRQVMETLGPEAAGWSRKLAEKELRHRLTAVDKGYRRPEPVTFAEFAGQWYEDGKTLRAWKPKTVHQYRSIVRRLVDEFGTRTLAEVRPKHVAEYVAAMAKAGYGPAAITRDISILHAIFDSARRKELVEANPAAKAERPKLRRRRWRILEPVEIQEIAKAFTDARARVVFLTLVITGVRRHELRSLRWRDVDLIENVLRVRDSKSEEGIRSIALPSSLAEELWQWRRGSAFQGEDEYVFAHATRGTRLDADWFAEQFEAARTAAGVTDYVRPFHDLRHTAITNDAAAGASELAVMTKAGHRSMQTTRIYLHLAGVVFREEAERLERRLLGAGLSTEPSTRQGVSEAPAVSLVPLNQAESGASA